jgi:riboflavin synthase
MFTGLIQEMAQVERFDGRFLTIASTLQPGIGDSIAVNGVCLTVVRTSPGTFTVEVADETRAVAAIENFRDRVHIEPAMRMGERFEGHIVQGHVDTVGTVERITARSNGTDFFIRVEPQFLDLIVPKGSVAIDGVSLTVNEVDDTGFRLTIVPHTLRNTLFATYRTGSRVNIETDLFARYVAHILRRRQAPDRPDWETIDHFQALY